MGNAPAGHEACSGAPFAVKDELQDASTSDGQASLTAQLDERFHELRAATETRFAEQAQQLEQVAVTLQGLLSECLHHLGAQRDPELERDWVLPPSQSGEKDEVTAPYFSSTSSPIVDQCLWGKLGSMPDRIVTDDSAHEDRCTASHPSCTVSIQPTPIVSHDGSTETGSRVVRQLLMQTGADEWEQNSSMRAQGHPSERTFGDLRSTTRLFLGSSAKTGCLSRLVYSPKFDQVAGVLILANAVFIGLQADWHAQHLAERKAPWSLPANVAFTGFFTLELLLKILVQRKKFFCSPDWRWNYFDLFVVLSGVMELVVELIDQINLATDMTFLRIMRIMKLVRVVRIVRVVRVFRELRIMLFSVVATVRSLLWTLISLFGLTFCAGVHITSAVAAHQERDFDPQLAKYFGSLPKTLLGLFQATAGGVDWRQLTDELEKVGWMVVSVFLLYVCLVIYAVMNILTGVCVNQATRAADDDIECVIRDEMSLRNGATNTLRRFFHEADAAGTGMITWPQLHGHLRTAPQVRAYFKALGIEVWDLRTFFDLLKIPGHKDEGIDIDQFVRGCLRMKGSAKSSDVMAMRLELDTIARMNSEIQASLSCMANQVVEEVRTTLKQDAVRRLRRMHPNLKEPLASQDQRAGDGPSQLSGNSVLL